MKRVVNVSIEEQLYEELRVAAFEHHFSLSAVINTALTEYNKRLKDEGFSKLVNIEIETHQFKRTRKPKAKR